MIETIPSGDGSDAEIQRKVLLVEDEELVALALVEELTRLGWLVVGPATSLEDAQDIVMSGVHLDAAILDVNLGGETSESISNRLRERGVPFIFATGYDDVAIPGVAEVGTLRKPYNLTSLDGALRKLLGIG